jgi:putative PIN family toxin of toxin-antitoxin system
LKKKKGRIRAVIDTNLFVSGFFAAEGCTCQLQELWITGAFELVVSGKILAEIENTLGKPAIQEKLFLIPDEEEHLLDLIREKALIVTADRYETNRITQDPTDNKFLACALEAGAHYIVSGDRHLLDIKHFHGIQIVEARAFVQKLGGKC